MSFILFLIQVGKALERFRATDPDRGGSSRVRYAIDRSSDRRRQFSISEDGTVTIQRALDREAVPTHQVKILAIDDGDPPKTATATLTVTVDDINDNAPRFLKDYRPVLPEHSAPRKESWQFVMIFFFNSDDFLAIFCIKYIEN